MSSIGDVGIMGGKSRSLDLSSMDRADPACVSQRRNPRRCSRQRKKGRIITSIKKRGDDPPRLFSHSTSIQIRTRNDQSQVFKTQWHDIIMDKIDRRIPIMAQSFRTFDSHFAFGRAEAIWSNRRSFTRHRSSHHSFKPASSVGSEAMGILCKVSKHVDLMLGSEVWLTA